MFKMPEPLAYMWQHNETGRVGFVEASQPLDWWKQANPRLAIVAPVHSEAKLKQVRREALEEAANIVIAGLGKTNSRILLEIRTLQEGL